MRTKLDNVIKEFLIERFGAESIDNRYSRFLQIAVSGLRDMNIRGNINTSKIEKLEVNSNDTVDLPNDYIDYIRISICFGGQMLALGSNPNVCPNDFDECGNISERTLTLTGCSSGIYSIGKDGENIGKNYGGGGGNGVGYFKVYEADGYISLQSFTNGFQYDEIILEYLADPSFSGGEHLVHTYDIETLKAWMWWKYIEANRTYGLTDKELAKKEYNRMKKHSRIMKNAFTIPDLLSALHTGFRPIPGI